MLDSEISTTVDNAVGNIRAFAQGCEIFKPNPNASPLTLLPSALKPLVVLGAKDSEMDTIQELCIEGGVPYAYASVKDAKTGEVRRIRPGERITEDNDATQDSYTGAIVPDCANAWAVEVTGGPELWSCTEIDHHFNHLAKAPPSSAFEASSLGQFLAMLLKHYVAADVSRLLGIEGLCDLKRIPITLRIEGAADHNLGATLRGDVPNIDAEIAAAYILKTRAATYLPGASWDQILEVFAECSRTLLEAPVHPTFERVSMGEVAVQDLTSILPDHEYDRPAFNGEAYPLRLRLLPVVAAYWRKTYAARIKTAHGWGLRMGGGGENIADAITMLRSESFQRELGLKVGAEAPQNVYCFPERGIGGGTFAE